MRASDLARGAAELVIIILMSCAGAALCGFLGGITAGIIQRLNT